MLKKCLPVKIKNVKIAKTKKLKNKCEKNEKNGIQNIFVKNTVFLQ